MTNGQRPTPNRPEGQPEAPAAAPTAPQAAIQARVNAPRQDTREAMRGTMNATERQRTPEGQRPQETAPQPSQRTEPSPPVPEVLPAPSPDTVRTYTPTAGAEGSVDTGKWGVGKYGTTLGIGATLAGAGSSLASWPIIGKIPYLPQAAGWLQSSIGSAAKYLGLSTGPAATNSVMAALPAWAGPALGGALTIPTALWAIGLAKGYITGKRYGGFWGHVRAGAGIFYQPLFAAYKYTMHARENAWKWTKKALGTVVGTPAKWGYDHLVKPVIPAVKPTVWGVGGAALGGAMFTGGTSLLVGAGAYAAINYLNNTGWFKGKGGAPGAPAGAAPAH